MDLKTVETFSRVRKKWKETAVRVKEFLRTDFPDVRVFVFGSILTDRTHPLSDVDILIVSEEFRDINKRILTHTRLRKNFGDLVFEFHLIPPEKLSFYSKLTDQLVEI